MEPRAAEATQHSEGVGMCGLEEHGAVAGQGHREVYD